MMLKMRIVKFEKAVAVQILEQASREEMNFAASNGWHIRISSGPAFATYIDNGHHDLSSRHIFLRGSDNSKDWHADILNFNTNKARDAYVHRLYDALKEYTDSLKETVSTENSDEIWEF